MSDSKSDRGATRDLRVTSLKPGIYPQIDVQKKNQNRNTLLEENDNGPPPALRDSLRNTPEIYGTNSPQLPFRGQSNVANTQLPIHTSNKVQPGRDEVQMNRNLREKKIGGVWQLRRKIGNGSFGEIYLAVNIHTGEQVAAKLETTRSKHPQLLYESRLIQHLVGAEGIPRLFFEGHSEEFNANIMIMQLLGPSLEDLFNVCGRKFSLKTILLMADQILKRVEFLHTMSFIHRDIKPDNFLIGLQPDERNIIFMIDFGLAKRYRDPRTFQHVPYKERKNLTGTARYASINAHLGYEQSRRDDLEGVAYVLFYFLHDGSLPWQGIKADSKQDKYKRIMECKLGTSIDALCRGHHSAFSQYLTYCRSLRFDDRPDYEYLRKLFRMVMREKGYESDGVFDWSPIIDKKGIECCYGSSLTEIKDTPNVERQKKPIYSGVQKDRSR
eukprot:GHVP01035266.1.p1 GENE.GHVP01035266.1~~GHVP01035266.1.p1  ORF type:complete len:441 (-),score=42.51 GHVP01035266.1:117-1439(-)